MHNTPSQYDISRELQPFPCSFYKCLHFLFLITTYGVISCPIHHHEWPHMSCTTPRSAKHSGTSFQPRSLLLLILISPLCGCVSVTAVWIHGTHGVCARPMKMVPRSSLIQNGELCVFLWSIHCLCKSCSCWVSACARLHIHGALPWMYFLWVCATVCCMQSWEALCLSCYPTCIPKTRRRALALVRVHAVVCVCTCLIVSVGRNCLLNCPLVLCLIVPLCVFLFISLSARVSNYLSLSISTCLLRDFLSLYFSFCFDVFVTPGPKVEQI